METINRRSFLAGTAAAGIGAAALGLAGTQAFADEGTEAEAAESETEENETAYEPAEVVACDLVVVGAGISGLGAAIEAAEAGLAVVLLEKEAAVGGTLPGTEGLMGLGSQLQTDAGTELPRTYELVSEELEYTNYRVDPLLWTEVIDNSGADIDWLSARGVNFETIDNYLDQSAYDTFHWWEGENGAIAGATLGTVAEEAGVTIMLSTPAVDLKTQDGAVVGVYAQNADGDIIEIDASAVLLSTGGLANDLDLLREKTGMAMPNAQSLYPINEVGDGLVMATSVGAEETSVSILNVLSVNGYTADDPISVGGCIQPVALYVNQDGERYLSESLYIEKFFALLTNAFNTQEHAYCLLSQNLVDILEYEGCYQGVASTKAGDLLTGMTEQLQEAAATEGLEAYMGETVEELAEAMGIDADTLVATVDRYNELCAAGEDDDFGKPAEYLIALETGPFYAVTPVICVFQTIGGIKVNRDMQVLDTEGTVIPGLYSSGAASCGLYKETYCYQVSGGMNCYCLYTGRKAAQTVAASLA